jgi:hypothetical protein
MGVRSFERGQVLPLVAICLAVLMGFAGMAIDVGYLEYQQRQQQSATDAAAIGGAQQLVYSGCGNQSVATTAAQNDAAGNGYTQGATGAGGSTIQVNVQNPPSSGPYAGNNCAVYVQIQSPHTTFFSQLFGHASMAETTEAVALVTAANPCILMLGTGQNTNFNGATVNAPTCQILTNGSFNFNGANVDAASIGEVDYSGSNNNGTFTGGTPVQMLPVADPCPEIAGCAYLTANPPSTSPCNGSYSSGPMTPGCYDSLNLHGATVTLSPGLYVFAGGSNFNGASISGTGVTIYIPAGASTNFNKVDALDISPPTSGDYEGVSFYQVPSNNGDLNLNGSNVTVSGLIYAPTAQINFNGNLGNYALLVASYVNFNSSSSYDFGPPGNGVPALVHKVVLAE